MEAPEDPPPAENPSAESSQITPQRRPIRKRPDSEGSAQPEVDTADFLAFLGGLYAQAKGGAAGTPSTNSEGTAEKGASLLQAKRLPRTGGTGGAGGTGNAGGNAGPTEAGTPTEANTVAPVSAPTPVLASMKPRATRPPPQSNWGRVAGWLLVVCLVAAGAGAAYWWWQKQPVADNQAIAPAQGPSAAPATPRALMANDEALETVDKVNAAVVRGEIKEAAALLADAQQRRIPLPGLRYQAALLALNLGETIQAQNLLDQSIDAGDAVPECCYLRASTDAARGDYQAASEGFAEAVKAAPFSPRYRFFLGESLRRQGKPAQAAKEFEQALRCRPSVADGDLIVFKLNLAEIESGRDEEFNKDLVNRLAQEDAPLNILLLGVAREINRADYAAATAYLQRAAKQASPPALQIRMRDYCFRLPPHEKERTAEWAALLQPPTGAAAAVPAETPGPGAKRPVVDPAARSLAESDPGTW